MPMALAVMAAVVLAVALFVLALGAVGCFLVVAHWRVQIFGGSNDAKRRHGRRRAAARRLDSQFPDGPRRRAAAPRPTSFADRT